MTTNGAKILADDEKSLVEMRRKGAEISISAGLACLGIFLVRVLAVLMARRVEIKVPIMVSLTVWHPGVPITKLNGKSRMKWINKWQFAASYRGLSPRKG